MKDFFDLNPNSKAGQPVLKRCLVVLLIFFSCVGASENAANARKALVIGNNAYLHVPKLRNARTDAEAVAKSLSEIGFKVTIQLDLNERGMRGAVRSFVAGLEGGDEAVFYYAGHGVQLGAANYLLPAYSGESDQSFRFIVTGADAVSELGGDDSSVGHDWAFPVLVFDSLGARRNDSPFKVSR